MRCRVLSPTCTRHSGDGVSARHRGAARGFRQLVDRLRLMIFPLLVGPSGREWAFEGVGESELALADMRVLDGRILLAEYAPTGRPVPS